MNELETGARESPISLKLAEAIRRMRREQELTAGWVLVLLMVLGMALFN